MLVTLNTDASFNPLTKDGTYAFWAISNNFKVKKSGVFKTKCLSPDDAEARSILNGIQVIISQNTDIKRIIINTDSLNAVALLKWNDSHIEKYISRKKKKWKFLNLTYVKLIRKFETKPIIEFRHVKAHTNIKDARSYVNNWCDLEAKTILRKLDNKF